MTGYTGTFQKKDGSLRTMRFLLIKDLPSDFVASKIKGGNKSHSLNEGMELVWDIDEGAFRIFNRSKVVDKIEEFEYTFNQ
jgi:hypothetical protein